MSNPYQLIVFDWEGTISDTLGLILHTVATEAHNLGFGDVDPYQARQYVDLGLAQALRKLFPHLYLTQHEQLIQAVQRAMITRPAEVCLIPGARETIQAIHDAHLDLAIASNKGQHSLARALHATGLDNLFKVTRCAGQVAAKPSPQMLEEIMDEFGQTPSTTLMVGDAATDMEMARSINVTAIGVDFYHQNKETLKAAGAFAVFDDYQLLAQFLKLPQESKGV
ncbi:HAD family hydrolase [Legionella sp. km772]|uniref:HAD family hydrolase n=1 Tax=Legionella sp. km772 TaxID=2498111 RepID=UPI000F8EBB16|nr:HAD-IA family hydrolase [Legionella sp. km772]RUR07596.1 HAD family hydrolase [Legionella sp. km772]